MLRTLSDTPLAIPDTYMQYGALGVLCLVLLGIFWKIIPKIADFVREMVTYLGQRIDGLGTKFESGMSTMYDKVRGIEDNHRESMTRVNGRLDTIDRSLEEVKTLVTKKSE